MTATDEIREKAFLDTVEEIVLGSLDEIRLHMEEESPNECVGLIWLNGQIQRLINQARSPSRFSISQVQLAERLAEMDVSNLLICVYHSHPSGTLNMSWDDKRSMKRQWERNLPIPWLIVTELDAKLWYLDDEGQFQYRSVEVFV